MMDANEKVGVVGLGIIGKRVAERLRDAGRHVYVWSRTPKPVPDFVGSPAEMAQLADVIQIFVTGGEELKDVVGRMKEKLGKRHLIINNSTSDPESVVDAYQVVRETGASFLDAPFTGSKLAAEKGALVYYMGGDPKVVEKARPVLEVSGREIVYLGRVGEASVLKIATNMISATTMEVLAEAYALVAAAGIEPERLAEALEQAPCASPLTSMKLPSIMKREYEPHFSLKNMFKDARYALDLAKRLGIELPASSTTANVMFRAIQKGLGEQDFSVIAKRYQQERNSTAPKEKS